jgi:hypothetical protein
MIKQDPWQKFYMWQTHMYGIGLIDPAKPVDIYKNRPMPCTPAGDFIGTIPTGNKGKQIVDYFNKNNFSVKQARTYLKDQ